MGIAITVCHLPPGTSKWNKIEHRLFSFIAMNWRGKPLVTHQTIVQLIGDDDQDRSRSALPTRSQHLPRWRQSLRRGIQRSEHSPATNSTAIGTTPLFQEPLLWSVNFRSGP